MNVRWRRAVVITLIVVAFALLWAAVAFEWLTEAGIIWGLALVVIAFAVLAVVAAFRKRPRPEPSDQLSASDEHSDLYLGRQKRVQPRRDVRETSQIGDGLPPDPLAIRNQND